MIDGCVTCTDYQTCKECAADKELDSNNKCKDKSSTPTVLIVVGVVAGVAVIAGVGNFDFI